jgi:hypothetical protein
MKCHRCRSVMTYERFYSPHDHFAGWRCIFCGEIIDQVILENRQTRMDSQNRARRKEPRDDGWAREPSTDWVTNRDAM